MQHSFWIFLGEECNGVFSYLDTRLYLLNTKCSICIVTTMQIPRPLNTFHVVFFFRSLFCSQNKLDSLSKIALTFSCLHNLHMSGVGKLILQEIGFWALEKLREVNRMACEL